MGDGHADPGRAEATSLAVGAPRGSYVRTTVENIGLPEGALAVDRSDIYCCGASSLTGVPCPLCTELVGFSYVTLPLARALVHEWVHTYGIAFDRVDGPGPTTPSILDGEGHWGRFTDLNSLMTASGLAGSVIGPGTTFSCETRSDLDAYDLYLMGLVPVSSLPDVSVMVDPVLGSGCSGTFSSLFVHPAADLVVDNGGARAPFPGPTAYDAAVIAVTPDASFTPAELAYFELFASFMSSGPPAGVVVQGVPALPFEAATGGAATLDTTL